MATATISIGRGVGREGELSDTSWYIFRSRVEHIAGEYGEVVFSGTGTGVYESREEETFTVIVTDVDDTDLLLLEGRLEAERLNFGQEAIALTKGETTFVSEPEPAYAVPA